MILKAKEIELEKELEKLNTERDEHIAHDYQAMIDWCDIEMNRTKNELKNCKDALKWVNQQADHLEIKELEKLPVIPSDTNINDNF